VIDSGARAMALQSLTLTERTVRLEPLSFAHSEDLWPALDPELTRWFSRPLRQRVDLEDFIAEALDCLRVELKTDSRNTQSREAILRLGAVEEGTFRSYMVVPDGRIRDSVYYSILAAEWPAAKAKLAARLQA
jgi:hypothetical protein